MINSWKLPYKYIPLFWKEIPTNRIFFKLVAPKSYGKFSQNHEAARITARKIPSGIEETRIGNQIKHHRHVTNHIDLIVPVFYI